MLVTGRNVLLRTARESDLDLLYEHQTDVEGLGLYFPIELPSVAAFRRLYAETGFWHEHEGDALICSVVDGSPLGVILFFKSSPYYDGYEIGYRLFNTASGGRGVTTEALALMTYLLFAWKKINRLELKIALDNIPSRRVAEKNGYMLEGVARGCLFLRGVSHDMAVYSLLRSEAPATLDDALRRIAQPVNET
jgi:RimJ/RimL family protein N-acetyltransferase